MGEAGRKGCGVELEFGGVWKFVDMGSVFHYLQWEVEVYVNLSKCRAYSMAGKEEEKIPNQTAHPNHKHHNHKSDRRVDFLRLKVPIFH